MKAFLCHLLQLAFSLIEYEPQSLQVESSAQVDLENNSNHQNASKGVDITEMPWVKGKPELAGLKGILVAPDWNGYIESFEFNLRTYSGLIGASEKVETALFEELRAFFHSESEAFQSRIKLSSVDGFHGKFLRFAAFKKDIELVKFYRKMTSSQIEMVDEEALEQIGDYFRTWPERFFDFFPPERFELFFKLGFDDAQLSMIAMNFQDQIIQLIRNVCCSSASSFLLKPEIKRQVLQMFHSLNEKAKLSVQLVLYYRAILNAEDIDLNNLWIEEYDIIAVLLGPRKNLALLQRSTENLLALVDKVAEVDPLVFDWVVENVTQDEFFREDIESFAELEPAKIPLEYLQIDKQFQVSESDFRKLSPDQFREFMAEGEKKMYAHLFLNEKDFTHSLHTCEPNFLRILSAPLIKYGTAAEFEIFCNRAPDELVVDVFFWFWKSHSIKEQFANCACILFDRIGPLRREDLQVEASFSEKFLDNPVVFERFESLQIGLCFDFHSIVDAIQSDELFVRMLPYRSVFLKSLLLSKYSFHLRLTEKPLKRLLKLLNMNVHQFLELYWTANKSAYYHLDLNYCCSVFVFLKRWKEENPQEVAKILASHRQSIEELVKETSVMRHFDESSLELLRAHLLLGQSIQPRF